MEDLKRSSSPSISQGIFFTEYTSRSFFTVKAIQGVFFAEKTSRDEKISRSLPPREDLKRNIHLKKTSGSFSSIEYLQRYSPSIEDLKVSSFARKHQEVHFTEKKPKGVIFVYKKPTSVSFAHRRHLGVSMSTEDIK